MKLWGVIVVLGCSLGMQLSAAEPYPPYTDKVWPEVRGLRSEVLMKAMELATKEIYGLDLTDIAKLKQPLPAPTSEQLLKALDKFLPEPTSEEWPVNHPKGRMPLPHLLIQGGILGADVVPEQYFPGASLDEVVRRWAYAVVWRIFMNSPSNSLAFEIMAKDATRKQVRTIDLLRVAACPSYWIADKLENKPNKKFWQMMRVGRNPCYRLIALWKFDSVDQSPQEFLDLYRECLFGSCTFLEKRAMDRMGRENDRRPEVIALLHEYLDSKPLDNDGTDHHMRGIEMGGSGIDAAQLLLKLFEKNQP